MRTNVADLGSIDGNIGGNFLRPAGEYLFRILEVKEGANKSGNQMFQIGLEIEAVDEKIIQADPDAAGNLIGKKYNEFIHMSPTSDFPKRKLKNFLDAAGVTISPDGSFDTDEAAFQSVYGRMVQQANKQTGELGNQIQRFWAAE
jgi:hypothetical protein